MTRLNTLCEPASRRTGPVSWSTSNLAIKALQNAGVEPDVWKIEGLGRRGDCQNVTAAARRDGRDEVGCIVLGRGSNEQKVVEWLRTAAGVPGFTGFAVGRTSFWEALVAWRDGNINRDQAIETIARRYVEWVKVFEGSQHGGQE